MAGLPGIDQAATSTPFVSPEDVLRGLGERYREVAQSPSLPISPIPSLKDLWYHLTEGATVTGLPSLAPSPEIAEVCEWLGVHLKDSDGYWRRYEQGSKVDRLDFIASMILHMDYWDRLAQAVEAEPNSRQRTSRKEMRLGIMSAWHLERYHSTEIRMPVEKVQWCYDHLPHAALVWGQTSPLLHRGHNREWYLDQMIRAEIKEQTQASRHSDLALLEFLKETRSQSQSTPRR